MTVRVLLVVCALAIGGSACGKHAAVSAPPRKVPVALVPPALGPLGVTEDDSARKTFTKVIGSTLVADGRLWGIRRGDQLVATLQVATLRPKVDLAVAQQRGDIERSLLSSDRERYRVRGVDVVQSSTEDRTVFLWFGRYFFEVLQVKGVPPDQVLNDVLAFQTASPAWEPAPRPRGKAN